MGRIQKTKGIGFNTGSSISTCGCYTCVQLFCLTISTRQ
uniref:Uncharacterized protein n=1 Tax=Rhizophora mucronata TaxID=61149 RepID=A0A2P2NXH0_RHIMU